MNIYQLNNLENQIIAVKEYAEDLLEQIALDKAFFKSKHKKLNLGADAIEYYAHKTAFISDHTNIAYDQMKAVADLENVPV